MSSKSIFIPHENPSSHLADFFDNVEPHDTHQTLTHHLGARPSHAGESDEELDGSWLSWYYIREGMKPFIPYLDKPDSFWEAADSRTPQEDDWTAVDCIRSWIQTCQDSHGGYCHEVSNTQSAAHGPSWLIDARRLRLVSAKPNMKYFALSYVWGQSSPFFCASTSNIEHLKDDNALEGAILPQTIRDAIQVVKLIGGDYLWVDSLCILQDDGPDKEAQLDSMGGIYANAVATIVAATGKNANAGLTDLTTCSFTPSTIGRPRAAAPNPTQTSTSDRRIRHQPRYQSENIMLKHSMQLFYSKWNKRGWTYQEQLLSRRKIVFQDETLCWECSCAAWSASQGPIASVENVQRTITEGYRSLGLNDDAARLPDLRRLSRIVALYNKRELTYPEDVLNAFAGIISKITPQYSEGFITGLPQMFFDSAMLWQPWDTMTRRVSKRTPEDAACLPSWSWVGWKGNFNSESWRSAYAFMRGNSDEFYHLDKNLWQQTSWRTISSVEWFRIDEMGKKHPISITGQRYQDLSKSDILPDGWTRHICDQSGKCFFRHQSDESREFWYPIPLVDIKLPRQPHIHCKRLWCQTRCAVLGIGAIFRNTESSKCVCTDLLDANGDWVGVLRHPFRDSSPKVRGLALNNKQEFIELSAGHVLSQETEQVSFDEWFRKDCQISRGQYEFYNVMAIDRVGSVAYRRAVGRVTKEAWEKQLLKTVEVVLG